MKLDGKKVLMVIPHTQFRDEEFFEPKKILEEEGATVLVASTTIRTCRGMKGGIADAQVTIADAKAEIFEGATPATVLVANADDDLVVLDGLLNFGRDLRRVEHGGGVPFEIEDIRKHLFYLVRRYRVYRSGKFQGD